MNLAAELQRGLKELEKLTSGFIEFNNVQIPCTLSGETRGTELVIGGRDQDGSLDVIVRQSAFTTRTGDSAISPTGDSTNPGDSGDSNLPSIKQGDYVLFRQRKYMVGSVFWDAFGAFWQIHLEYRK